MSIRSWKSEVIADRLQEVAERLGVYFAQLLSLRHQDVAAVALELAESKCQEMEAHRGNIHDRMAVEFDTAAKHDSLAQSTAAEVAHFTKGIVGIDQELARL